jgi:hypothetical protein
LSVFPLQASGVRAIVVGAAAALCISVAAPPAYAIEQFYAQLEVKYVKWNSKKPNDVVLAAAFEQARCTICHPGDDKHKLTQYGGILAWRINKFDKTNKKKIQAALEEVGAIRTDPHNPKSPTYNEIFREGRLPPNPMH